MKPIPKCTTASRRHVWEHVKNVTRSTQTGSTVHIRLVGRYRCAYCAQRKDGQPTHEVAPGPIAEALNAAVAAPAVDSILLQVDSKGGAL
jgi:hypothetical protein